MAIDLDEDLVYVLDEMEIEDENGESEIWYAILIPSDNEVYATKRNNEQRQILMCEDDEPDYTFEELEEGNDRISEAILARLTAEVL